MNWLRGIGVGLLIAASALSSSGCLKKALLEGQIKGTRTGSNAVNTLHDFEVAQAVARAGLGQLEGFHYLAPDNADAVFLLTRGWGGATFGFTEDEYELAVEKGDDLLAEYHRMRARAGYERAKHYAVLLLGHTAPGFEQAKKNADTMKSWLKESFTEPEQAEDLLWAGYAWISHVSVSKDMPEIVGELYVGVMMIERSVELDETAVYATGHTILGAYHARTAMSELDESKQHFEKAIQLNEGKFLPTKLNFAQRYYCAKGDKVAYEKLLHEVLAAGDPLPEARLQNVIAKRRARRYLGNKIWQEECGFGG